MEKYCLHFLTYLQQWDDLMQYEQFLQNAHKVKKTAKALKMNVILIFCIFNLQLQVLANLQVAFVKVMK